ncbi:MAG: TonB-dependent receptor [Bacteroidetes bacterium MedPE-SWsnd-G2]|nr:MAG: TonB-dependent receptor [Bacteroidetes bacterium MedPE-SWsnd-G2]
MKKTNNVVLGALVMGASLMGYAQKKSDSLKIEQLDEVVITDSKFKLKRENSGKVVTRITQEQLQNLKGRSIAEVVNMVSGIEINGTKSNAGQNLSYFVRGGRNRQVLVLIDGVAVTDASQIANDYDLRLLNSDQVDSIEILKGASSTLYGTGAATAVINITLKKSSKKAVALNINSVLGTSNTQDDERGIKDSRNSVSLNGTIDKFSYLASFGNQYTSGFSAVANGTENDVFNSINGNVKLGYQFSEKFNVNLYGSFDEFKSDFDDGFAYLDADNVSLSEQFRVGISSEFKYKNGSITLNAARNTMDREIQSDFPSIFNSEGMMMDLFNKYTINSKFYTVLGVNVLDNEMESYSIPFGGTGFNQDVNPETANFTNIDPYANVVYVSEFGLNVNAGARLNNHSEYGSHVVFNVNPSFTKSYDFGYVKGLLGYSTAYIAPSLYQLFEPNYGNPDLKPEENATIEAGVEVNFTKKATLSLVYFNRAESNFIDFVDTGNFVFQYNNIDEDFTASGIEFEGKVNIVKSLNLLVNATYTKVDESLDLRIPEIKVNGQLQYTLKEATYFSLNYQFNDERNDSFYNPVLFQSESVTLDSYSLLDFYVSQKLLKDKVTLYANITNIFNEDYQELYGYNTKGRNFYLGLSLNL